MPFYQFLLETVATPEVVTERIRSLVREKLAVADA
jgi:hypothetical protein